MPSPNPPAASPSAPPVKNWKVGTLTYTSGGLILLFVWLLFGDFAWSMRDRSVTPMASWFLKELNVSNVLFGLIMSSAPALVGLLFVPYISVKSDRYRSRWGRRIPFLTVTTLVSTFGMLGIAFTSTLAKKLHPFVPGFDETTLAICCFVAFWTAFEFAALGGQSVFQGLINDVVPKELLGRFFGLFRTISLLDGIAFNYWIMGHIPSHFTLILTSIAIFYGVSFCWVCFKVKEGEYPPVEAPAPSEAPAKNDLLQSVKGIRSYLRECFTHRYYLSVFLMLTGAALAFAPVNTFAIPFARSVGVSMEVYGKAVAASFCISLILAFPLGWLADRFHPVRVTTCVLALHSFVCAIGAIFAHSAEAFVICFVLHSAVGGAFLTSSASLGQRLYPQTRFGQFASAAGAMGSLCMIVFVPAIGIFIDLSGNIYRYTFIIGGCFGVLAFAMAYRVLKQFMALGGPRGYVAPE